VKGTDGTISAQYEYGPFAEPIRVTGIMGSTNPIRFSCKYTDDESDFLYSGHRYYNPSTGRWLSRDPIKEAGGLNLYLFVNNESVSAVDLLGLVIETTCPIDDYLKSLSIRGYRWTGKYRYDYAGSPDTASGIGSARLIIVRMLQTAEVFKPATTDGTQLDNLKKHVAARQAIVNNALATKFGFRTGQPKYQHIIQPEPIFKPGEDPQKFFNSINNEQTEIACHLATLIVFETGNKFRGTKARNKDGVWIPGDWTRIRNKSQELNPSNWKRGYEGENLIHTGFSSEGEMFWGHFTENVNQSEKQWFDFVRSWTGMDRKQHGDPEWRERIVYPKIGLE
jgi:RHS repeat-associated protein